MVLMLWGAAAHSDKVARPLILGGYETVPGQWPWMAALLEAGVTDPFEAQYCGGSLVHPRWVMTAAHCVTDRYGGVLSPQYLDVLVGATGLSGGEGTRVGAKSIRVHAGFNRFTLENDIAVIELPAPLPVAPVQPAGPSIDQFVFAAGRVAELLGWGSTDPVYPIVSDTLRQVALPVADQAQCAAWWWPTQVTDGMMCLRESAGGKDTCTGDSGGPALIWENGRWEQAGITSFGVNGACGLAGSYGVYTRVSRYAAWVSNQVCEPGERPARPEVSFSVQGNHASLSIASGTAAAYRLFYAPVPWMTPIAYLDLGAAQQFGVDLPAGSDYFAAVQGYNGPCLGAVSEIVRIAVP